MIPIVVVLNPLVLVVESAKAEVAVELAAEALVV